MSATYRISDAAETDLLDIWAYIAYDNPDAADRVLDKVYAAFTLLGEHPGAGHLREDLSADTNLRFWSVYSYFIVYRKTSEPIEIIRVLSARRDVASILKR